MKKHKHALLIWITIYPLITVIYYMLGNRLFSLPIPMRTLIVTIIAVPVMVYILLPVLNRIIKKPSI